MGQHAADAIGNAARGAATDAALGTAGRVGQVAGAALTVADTAFKMRDIWRVGTGRASPQTIRHIVPHVVLAWRMLRGAPNLPYSDFRTTFSGSYRSPGLQATEKGHTRTQTRYSSTAPGHLKRYGYDPMTDTIARRVTSFRQTHRRFNGAEFNRWYRKSFGPVASGTMGGTPGPPIRITPPPPIRITPPPPIRITPPPRINFSAPRFHWR